jgi:hypothetical protein
MQGSGSRERTPEKGDHPMLPSLPPAKLLEVRTQGEEMTLVFCRSSEDEPESLTLSLEDFLAHTTEPPGEDIRDRCVEEELPFYTTT